MNRASDILGGASVGMATMGILLDEHRLFWLYALSFACGLFTLIINAAMRNTAPEDRP